MWTFLLFSLLPACFTSEPEVQIRFNPVTQLGVDCQREDDAEACYQYALKVYPEPSEDADYRHVFEMFKRGCDLDHPKACFEAALLRLEEKVSGSPEEGLELSKRACRLKFGDGCNNVGVSLANSSQVERAAESFEEGCALQSAKACTNLASLHLDKKLPDASPEVAARLSHKGCQWGHLDACYLLAVLGIQDRAPLPNPLTVQSLLESGCNDGHAFSCDTYAEVTRLGTHGVPKDAEAAAHLYARACELGVEEACE